MAAPSVVGLDIGSMSIRAAEAGRTKDGPVLSNFGYAPVPPGVVQGGVIIDEAIITALLKELWATGKFRTKRVVLGVTNPQVVVREMAVNNLPRAEMRQALPFQVRDALPLPVEKSLLDFCPLEPPGTKETVRGLLVAAPKDAVLTAVKATERAGLHVERVDLASFALRARRRPGWTSRSRRSSTSAAGRPPWSCTRTACRRSCGPSPAAAPRSPRPWPRGSTSRSTRPSTSSAASA